MPRSSVVAFVHKPANVDGWLTDLALVAEEGTALFREALRAAPREAAVYLVLRLPDTYAALMRRATAADARKSKP